MARGGFSLNSLKKNIVLQVIFSGIVFLLTLFFFPLSVRADSYSILSAGAGIILDDVYNIFSGEDWASLGAGAGVEENLTISGNEAEGSEEDGLIAGYRNLGVAHVDNHLNIRKEPDENSDLVGKMTKNAGCEILEESGEWAHIKSGKVDGYAKLEFLYTGPEALTVAKDAITLVATVNTTTLFVREKPDGDSPVMTMIPMGEDYEVTEGKKGDAWLKVAIDDDEGYISSDYVKLSEQLDKAMSLTELKYGEGVSDVRVNLINYAKQFIGNPYKWGGVSLTKGCDCSGYVQQIFRKFGISLPRTSREQVNRGKKVSASEAQPGDLFFYAKYGTINHVGIYIGGGQIVNAHSRRTGIRINSAYYRKPAAVRRLLD